jgi:uncharacterized protein YndB with AHSA1/START domain
MAEETYLVFEELIEAPAELIYRAFTSAAGLREWLCDASSTNPAEDGWIFLAWNQGYFANGAFTQLIPNKAVSFTWMGRGEPGWSKVDVVIAPTKTEAFNVVLHHSGLGDTDAWSQAREQISKGWELGLTNLKSTLETGRNLRVMNRPLIGIFPLEFDLYADTEKKREGLPVEYGVWVSNVVPGFGADKAGIQSDDLIIAIDGKKVKNITSLFGLLDEYEPDDKIVLDVYRGSEKLAFNVDTTPQIVQDLPGPPEELAKEIEIKSTQMLENLKEILSDVTEAEASYSLGPETWSVKETIVHFILHERNLQTWINDMVFDPTSFCDVNPAHCLFRLRATLTTYPTLNELVAELRRTFKETVATVAFLEPSFTQRKASYWRMGFELMERYIAYQEFVDHIRETIDKARSEISA